MLRERFDRSLNIYASNYNYCKIIGFFTYLLYFYLTNSILPKQSFFQITCCASMLTNELIIISPRENKCSSNRAPALGAFITKPFILYYQALRNLIDAEIFFDWFTVTI